MTLLSRLRALWRRPAPPVVSDPLIDELHALEAQIGPEGIRIAAGLLMLQGWTMNPPPPGNAWRLAYQQVLNMKMQQMKTGSTVQ